MGRALVAVITGYVVSGVFTFVTFAATFFLLGREGVLPRGGSGVSSTWVVSSIVFEVAGAFLAGWVCARIAPGWRAVQVLAALALVLGLAAGALTSTG